MMKRRILTACLVSGSILGGVSLLMAPQMAKDEASKAAHDANAKSAGAGPAAGALGVICFGTVDIDGKLVPLFPREFPNPSFITELAVKEGQEVKEGDVLLKFDVANLECEVAKAKAGVARAQAAVETQKAKLAEAEEAKATTQPNLIAQKTASWQAVQAKYEAATLRVAELRRVTNLTHGSQFDVDVAQKELEGLRNAAEAERLGVEGLKQMNLDLKIEEAKAGVGEATAAVTVQRELLKQAEDALARMGTLTAPCNAVVLRVDCAKGMTLGAQTRVAPLTIQPKMKFVVRAEVDQEYALHLKVGQTASMSDEADPKVSVAGKVVRIAPAYLPKRSGNNLPFDQMNEQRVLECLIEIEGDAGKLRLGQKLRVKLVD